MMAMNKGVHFIVRMLIKKNISTQLLVLISLYLSVAKGSMLFLWFIKN